jgi:hypothetical protein
LNDYTLWSVRNNIFLSLPLAQGPLLPEVFSTFTSKLGAQGLGRIFNLAKRSHSLSRLREATANNSAVANLIKFRQQTGKSSNLTCNLIGWVVSYSGFFR